MNGHLDVASQLSAPVKSSVRTCKSARRKGLPASAQGQGIALKSVDDLKEDLPTLAFPRGLRRLTSRKGIITVEDVNEKTVAVVLAGGAGSADNPLARYRALGAAAIGNLQLVDVAISNCIRSGINKVYVLTQWNSHTLNTHLTEAYPPAVFGGPKRQGFVDVLACHQTPTDAGWYKGSADAVRRNLPIILESYRGAGEPDDVIVLAGEALYRMDFGNMVRTHREQGADVTVATRSVPREGAQSKGLCKTDASGRITDFLEKPIESRLPEMEGGSEFCTPTEPFEASMGIYIFKREVLVRLLMENESHYGAETGPDIMLGGDVIPHALRDNRLVVSHHHQGYWRNVSGLRDLFEVNLELASPRSPVSQLELDQNVAGQGKVLPPAIIHNSSLESCLVGEGSVIRDSTLKNVVLGCNSYVSKGCSLTDTLVLGNDIFSNDRARAQMREQGIAVLGIGENTTLRSAVVDGNAAIGNHCRIENTEGVKESDRTEEGFVISDGIVVILRQATIPDGTII